MSARPENLSTAGLRPPSSVEWPIALPSDAASSKSRLAGKRAGMVVFSVYPFDPRPRRAAEALLKEGMQVDLICEGDEHAPKRETIDRL
jgi:hypothetical protein